MFSLHGVFFGVEDCVTNPGVVGVAAYLGVRCIERIDPISDVHVIFTIAGQFNVKKCETVDGAAGKL